MADSSHSMSSTSMSLLAGVQIQDAAAWNRLVELYAPVVIYWLKCGGLPPEDLQDVFQEVFQATALHVRNFQKERQSDTFRGWLKTITRHKIADYYRSHTKFPRAVGGSQMLRQLDNVPAQEDATDSSIAAQPSPLSPVYRTVLDRVRHHFQERTWQAFQLTVLEARSPKDVAAELSMTPGAVRVAKSRVLQRIRAELGDRGDVQ